MRLFALLLLLPACNYVTGKEQFARLDPDGDGYPWPTDCDGEDAGVHPGAEEVCDNKDQDCDQQIDEDATDAGVFYADTDQDGFGDPGSAVSSCEAPSGTVADGTDCYDRDPSVSPASVEVCGGLDDDCDTLIDDDDPSVSDAPTWYADSDGDNHGDASRPLTACVQPLGYVAAGDDCDDGDLAAHPGGTEVCGGGDEDCDGSTDEAGAGGETTWFPDADGDGYGAATPSVTGCVAPAQHVDNGTDCNDANAAAHPGAAEVCDAANLDEDCDGHAEDADGDSAGKTAFYADADGDTYGAASTLSMDCDAPSGRVANGSDCDDHSAAVHPGAVETCNGTDDDCDGLTDDADTGVTGKTAFHVDGDGDGFGHRTLTVLACAAAPGRTSDATDCDDVVASIHPGAVDTWYDGVDSNCDGADDFDQDADGYRTDAFGGLDCNDTDPLVFPGHVATVPTDAATIQDAVDAACVTDTIEVLAGTYHESVNLGGRSLTLHGAGPGVTVIDAGGAGIGVIIGTGTLSSLTVTGGSGTYGAGVRIDSGPAVLSDMSIEYSFATGSGGGIYASSAYGVTLTDIALVGDDAPQGGGITLYGTGIVGRRIDVRGSRGGGPAVVVHGTAQLDGMVVAGGDGTGLLLAPSNSLAIQHLSNAAIIANSGDGVVTDAFTSGQLTVTDSIIAFNGGFGIHDLTTFDPAVTYDDAFSNTSGAYSGMLPSPAGRDGNIDVDPGFLSAGLRMPEASWDLHLAPGSPLIDAGDPGVTDPDGSRSDIGAYGGPNAAFDYYADADADGLYDGWETAHGLDTGVDDTSSDPDGDGMDNDREFDAGSDPQVDDTDGDGTTDPFDADPIDPTVQ